jgi:nucleoside 2-deoxyribosyltransferase
MSNKKPRLYLAGPINGCTDAECKDWRATAIAVLGDRYDIVDPMVRDYRGIESTTDPIEIVEQDLKSIFSCDAVLANCFKPSAGTSCEIVYATIRGIFVVSAGSDSPWVIYHSDQVFKEINEAIEFLSKIYDEVIQEMGSKEDGNGQDDATDSS